MLMRILTLCLCVRVCVAAFVEIPARLQSRPNCLYYPLIHVIVGFKRL